MKRPCNIRFWKAFKGTMSRVDMRRSVHPRSLKNSLFEINGFMAFQPRFLVFPSAIMLSFPSRVATFPAVSGYSTSRRHIESASVQLENIRLTFSSFVGRLRMSTRDSVLLRITINSIRAEEPQVTS